MDLITPRHPRAGEARPEDPGPSRLCVSRPLGSRVKPESDARKFGALLVLSFFLLTSGGQAQDKAGVFDFYVLALSWSPTFCATREEDRDSAQCREGAGHGFIVHGLWPQFDRGYPESCQTDEPQRVPLEVAEDMLDIMPDRGLVFSQWRKHGTCTGLSQSDYFAAVRAAAERVTIPPEFLDVGAEATLSAAAVERAFLAANPDMAADGVAVACEAGSLEEVRICLTRELDFRGCTEVDRRACRREQLSVPAPG